MLSRFWISCAIATWAAMHHPDFPELRFFCILGSRFYPIACPWWITFDWIEAQQPDDACDDCWAAENLEEWSR